MSIMDFTLRHKIWKYIGFKAEDFGRIISYELAAAVMVHFELDADTAFLIVTEWIAANIEYLKKGNNKQ